MFRDGSDIRKNRQTRNYVLGVANGVTIPKKRWKKQVLTLIITTNHAILVALVECLSRDWFVYLCAKARINKRMVLLSSGNTSSRNSDTGIYSQVHARYEKNPVKSKYKLSSFDSRSAPVRRVSYRIITSCIEEFLDSKSNRESNA